MRFPTIETVYSLFQKNPVVVTDSRQTPVGSIFFALRGDNFNGNQFAETALVQGCSFSVIDDERYYKGDRYILTRDCLQLLQELATYHRAQCKIPVIGITGSNGKTTTKELLKCILEKRYKVLATKGNLNNHIGVPLTILSVTSEVEIAIIEMGANHIGEIAMLCEISQPDFGLITNIGKAHLGEFGNYEGVIKAKTELYKYIKKRKAKLFINAENSLLLSHASDIAKITYGTASDNFCTCQVIETSRYVHVKYENETIASHLIGNYNFENIAAAICAGKYFGIDSTKIKEAIEAYFPSNNRSQVMQTKRNTLILDAYNANPSSMKAAIENFYGIQEKSKWLILGDMLELGPYAIQEHKDILLLILEKKFQNTILVGELFTNALSEMTLAAPNILLFKNSDELASVLKTKSPIRDSSWILLKGSRGIKLEKCIEFL